MKKVRIDSLPKAKNGLPPKDYPIATPPPAWMPIHTLNPVEVKANRFDYNIDTSKYPDLGINQPLPTFRPIRKPTLEEEIQRDKYLEDRQNFTPDKVEWYESFNPYNWGVNDYSNYSSFNSAFRNAREAGEKEFMFKGERYNTNLVDKKHSDDYWDQKNFLREYYKNEPFKPLSSHDSTMFAKDLIKDKHGTTWSEYYNKILPERGNLTYNDKRYNEIQDSLEMLSEYGYKQDPAKRQELNRYIQSNLGNNELINLEEPYYFSMTNNPIVGENGTTLGFVDPRNKKLFVSTDRGGNFNTTYVHELSHKGDLGDVYLRTPKVDYETLNAFNQGRLDQGMVDYLVDPTEIEARKMSTLYYFKKNGLPYQTGKITSKQVFDLNLDIISHPEKYPHDVVQLFQLFDGQTGKLVKYFNNDFSKKKGGDISIPNLSRQEGREMPFGLPLKEQNIYTLPEYIQPINPMTGEILPDPRRPDLGMGTKASEYKYTYGFDEGDVDVPSIVAGQYIGDQALDRYRLTGERFKTMADPGSYSKFYMQMRDLGLMQEKKGGVVKKVKIKSIPKNWKSQ